MRKRLMALVACMLLCVGVALFVTGCGGTAQKSGLADGTYQIEVETDSSMFRSESCQLKVENGAYNAVLSLPGEGFSKLYFGTAEEAAAATEGVYDYYLNDEGKYTFEMRSLRLPPLASAGTRGTTTPSCSTRPQRRNRA